jgi:predicted MFS family arabinose efflux permease
MQQTPVRLLLGLRPKLPASVLMGSIISTVVFTATPFLLPALSDELGRPVGVIGLISTAQLAGFVLATWGASRILTAGPRVIIWAAALGVIANLASAFTPWFSLLLLARLLSGIAIGLIDWMAWREVFGDDARVGDVAVIGPVVGTLMAPVLAIFVDLNGSTLLFIVFAALHLVPLTMLHRTTLRPGPQRSGTRHRPTPHAALILALLMLMTLGGSSVFVYAAAIGLGATNMSALAVSLAFSANAIFGIPSARYRGGRRRAGMWVAITALCSLAISVPHLPVLFVAGMAIWGFGFWMAVPAAFSLLAARSRYPTERAGDAQAVLAFGRVFGPAIGGLIYTQASVRALGLFSGSLMFIAAAGLWWVEYRTPPIDPALQELSVHTAQNP